MKKFEDVSKDGKENAFRRGFTVPPGGVNVAWAKSPALSPKNNTIIIDTSRIAGDNANISTKAQKIAYADAMGILQDQHGNTIWDEEYPIISDLFLPPTTEPKYGENLVDEDILPYLHVSRHFHVDFNGMTFGGHLIEVDSSELKVVDKNGTHYTYPNGKKRYKTSLVRAESNFQEGSRDGTYRVYVFLDMNPEAQELYLTYNKVEVAKNGALRNQQIDYREQINPRPYYSYVPEESDTLDLSFAHEKIFSTKPINLKNKALNLPQNDYQGWKIHVPRKAIADPRIFQLMRWRLACEYTQPVAPQNGSNNEYTTATTIKAGVIVPKNGNHLSTRANYFFYQMNSSDYNFSKAKFVNPLKTTNGTYNAEATKAANYWHVDIDTVTVDQLAQFDVLIWAPTTPTLDIAQYRAKIDHFVENVGGTFILETSSFVGTGTGLNGFVFSPRMENPTGSTVTDTVVASQLRIFDATANNPNDEFSSYGMWKEWPPNVRDILTNYTDTGSILADAGPIAGWNLTNAEKVGLSPYDEISPQVMRLQYIAAHPADFRRVLESRLDSNNPYRATLVHKKYNSGGNFFVSTGCIFEDHLFEPSGDMIMRTMQMATWDNLPSTWKVQWDPITSSYISAAEFKFRYNVMMLATVFKPSPPAQAGGSSQIIRNSDRQSTTIYTDWISSWVINPENGVLSDKEIDEFDFVLQPTSPQDLAPTWQRILSPKTAKQLIQDKLTQLQAVDTNLANSLQGASKRYFVIVTNPEVQVPASPLISENTILTAWTKAYSPPFVVPYYLGPYKVRDEMIAGSGVGDGRRMYPPKQWAARAKMTYLRSSSETNSYTARVRMTATVRRLLRVKDDWVTRKVWVPGLPYTVQRMHDTVLHWTKNGHNSYATSTGGHQYNMQIPNGIQTWTDAQYGFKANNWPFWGRANTISQNMNTRHHDVLGIQKILNGLTFFGVIPGPGLAEDGFYGNATAWRVIQFQQALHAQYVDGIVDSETFSLLGMQLYWMADVPGYREAVAGTILQGWIDEAKYFLNLANISDDWGSTAYGRISWFTNGPSEIAQAFMITFNPNDRFAHHDGSFEIYQVNVMPWTGPQYINYFDLTHATSLHGYTFQGNPGYVNPMWQHDGEWITMPVAGQRFARSIVFNINSGNRVATFWGEPFGTARGLGVRDVAVYARREFPETVIAPGSYQDELYDPGTIRTIEDIDTVTYEANLTFQAGVGLTLNPMQALSTQIAAIMADVPRNTIDSQTISEITWNVNSVEFPADPGLANFFDVEFDFFSTTNQSYNTARFTFNGFGMTTSSDGFSQGLWYGKGDNQYYTRTETGVINPYAQRYGWVTKEEGVKLICDATGKPMGFPFSIPNLVGENVHYTNYVLEVDDTDQTTYVGFWDNVRKEWVTNAAGEPVMSYYDYIRRGPLNVFIASQTSYELDINSNLPNANQSIDRPFKWAMPVYGVTTGSNAKIQIEPLSPDLGPTDVWSIPVKTGNFSRAVTLRPKVQGSYTGWTKDYQGSTVYAYYNIPEAEEGPWSRIYGRPYVDIESETPLILDDNVIQVRQYPILSVQEPTSAPSLADPWMPVFKVSIRQTLASPWVEIDIKDIKDYDLTRGVITLKSNLPSNDPRLIKVDYTSENKVYHFKWDGTNRINLNPYINGKEEWRDKPLYVYMLPEYVADKDYKLIPTTVQARTLRVTTDPSMFSPAQANYDPLAILLGIVYITTSFDINQLSVLDTRRRGGGVSTAYTDNEIIGIEPEAEHYWDVIPPEATSYQKGGFIVIRFPAEIINQCTEQQVINAIERNITLGVRYRIESLQGNPLEWPKDRSEEES